MAAARRVFFCSCTRMTKYLIRYYSQEEIESLRERMQAQTSLVVVGSADDALRVGKTKRQIEGVTQAMVDNMIVDEISEFASACIVNPPAPRDFKAENAMLSNGGSATMASATSAATASGCTTPATCSASSSAALLHKKRRGSISLDPADISIGPAAAKAAKTSRLMLTGENRNVHALQYFCRFETKLDSFCFLLLFLYGFASFTIHSNPRINPNSTPHSENLLRLRILYFVGF